MFHVAIVVLAACLMVQLVWVRRDRFIVCLIVGILASSWVLARGIVRAELRRQAALNARQVNADAPPPAKPAPATRPASQPATLAEPGPDDPVGSEETVRPWRERLKPRLSAKFGLGQLLKIELREGPLDIMGDRDVAVVAQVTRLRLGDIECDPMDLNSMERNVPNWAVQGGGSGERCLPLITVPVEQAPGGPTLLTYTIKMEVYENETRKDKSNLVARFWKEATTTVTLPPGLKPVRLIHDASCRDTLASSLRVTVRDAPGDLSGTNDGRRASILIIDGPVQPVGIAFEVTLRYRNGEAQGIGVLKCCRDEKIHAELTIQRNQGYPLEPFCLILLPSPSKAAEAGFLEVLDEKIMTTELRPTRVP